MACVVQSLEPAAHLGPRSPPHFHMPRGLGRRRHHMTSGHQRDDCFEGAEHSIESTNMGAAPPVTCAAVSQAS